MSTTQKSRGRSSAPKSGSGSSTSSSSARKSKKTKKRSLGGRIVVTLLKVLGTVVFLCVVAGVILALNAVAYIRDSIIPEANQTLSAVNVLDVNQSSTMYYTDSKTGELVELLTLHGSENRVWVDYDSIPEDLINATVAIEDQRFWTHSGVDWGRTVKAISLMFSGGDIQGGSTITQQLLKNITSNDEVTVQRKVMEIFLALEFEKTHSKEEIMEWYLNYIYLGDSCYGIYTASLNYFGKEPEDLTLAECASLISITNNPTAYNPYRHPENNLERRNLVLSQMESQGMITEEEMLQAQSEPLVLSREETESEQVVYTWYEDQVIEDVITDLMDTYDLSSTAASNLVYQGGLSIETCLDPNVQKYVDAVYLENESIGEDSENGLKLQSGITVIDNETGYVVALAGGIGDKNASRLYNRASQALRQTGSSIKPLSVYAPALNEGLITPYSVVDDAPILYNAEAWPANAVGYYSGLVTVNEAVRNSTNTAAVNVLQDLVGTDTSFEYLTDRFGITSLIGDQMINGQLKSDQNMSSLALGGQTNGISTYEMAAAYAAFARDGEYKEPRTYSRVIMTDTDGNETVLLDNTGSGEKILKESTVYYMNQMLENVVASGTGTAAAFDGMTIAGKTGTTTSNYDKWFIGYTPYYTAAVWIGYDEQEEIADADTDEAMTIWKEVMEPVHRRLKDKDFEPEVDEDEDLVTVAYCKDSGKLATAACRADIRGSRVGYGTYIKGTEPTEECDEHTYVKVCTKSPVYDDDGNDTGLYHLAGDSCPDSTCKTISVVDFDRFYATPEVEIKDDMYLLSYLEDLGTCTYHGYRTGNSSGSSSGSGTTSGWSGGTGTGNGTGTGTGTGTGNTAGSGTGAATGGTTWSGNGGTGQQQNTWGMTGGAEGQGDSDDSAGTDEQQPDTDAGTGSEAAEYPAEGEPEAADVDN